MDSFLTNNPSSSSKPDRKTIEKNRRNQMKNLFTHLNSLLPHHPQGSSSSSTQEATSFPDKIDEATQYIKNLEAHLEILKEKKRNLVGSTNRTRRPMASSGRSASLKPPQIEVCVKGDSVLEVVLITGLDCQFIFTEALRVLHDEGVEVVHANFTTLDDVNVYHTIHAKIEVSPQSQEAVARITERLNRFSFDPNSLITGALAGC